MGNWFKRTTRDSGNGWRTTETTSPNGTTKITRSHTTREKGNNGSWITTSARVSGPGTGNTRTTNHSQLGTQRTSSVGSARKPQNSAFPKFKTPKLYKPKAMKTHTHKVKVTKARRMTRAEAQANTYFIGMVVVGLGILWVYEQIASFF